MTKRSFLILLVFLSMLIPSRAWAKVSVQLNLDRNQAAVTDSIKLVISVSGTRSSDSVPVIKGADDFNVTSGGTSSRFEIINGKVNSGIEYTFFLHPRKEGSFRIGPAEVIIDGRTFRSNTGELTIHKARAGIARGNLFLTAAISSPEAYIEEQLIYTLRLHRRINVSNISLELPESNQFALKKLEGPQEYQTVIGDHTYQVLELRYALIPSREGEVEIQPSRMHMTAFESSRRSQMRSFFDDPFFSAGQPRTVASESFGLTVLALPETGRPPGFTGLVGDFEIDATLEPASINAGESATLTLRLAGQGNVNSIPDLRCPDLEYAKVYADQPVLKVETDEKGLKGLKTMKWALVGEKEGTFQVPSFSVSFFDPENSKYLTLNTSPLFLSILPGQKEQVLVSAAGAGDEGKEGQAKKEVKEIGRDILPVHTSMGVLKRADAYKAGQLFFISAVILPFLVYLAAFAGVRIKRNSQRSMASIRAKKSAGRFIREYRKKGSLPDELSSAIRNYLNDRLSLNLGSLTAEEAAGILRSNGVSNETSLRLCAVLKKIENAVYTGRGNDPCDTGEDIPSLIRQVEKEIR
ncbi:MAG TPA: protein BatD [Desulfobacteraceae bacterium]|nr:protein BatD [Desulfobacteraceae bacterium]